MSDGSYASIAGLPGPAPIPLLGWRANALRFLLDPIAYIDALPSVRGVSPFVAGGCPPVLLVGDGPAVFAIGGAANKVVLGDMEGFHSQRVPGPPGAFQRLTAGLFSMNTPQHGQQRRLIQPAFHKRRIEGYRDDMVALTAQMLDGWTAGETRDVLADLQRLTFTIASRTLFGIEAGEATFSLGASILEVVQRSMSPLTVVSPDLPGSPRRALVTTSAKVEAGLRALVAERRAAGNEASDVLSTLVRTRDEAGEALTDDELIGQMFLLFFAGHDTTRNALAWALFLLSQHPAVADALVDELDGVLHGDAPTMEQLALLPLLDRVVKESLRLFPPAPLTARMTMRPTTIAGVDLPVGTEVHLSYYHTHRDPDVFAEPTRFRPERWATETPTPYEYVPFGAGARQCIGAGFAGLEIRVVLAMLLQRFRPVLAEGARVDRKTSIVLSPHPGLPMLLRPRGSRVTAPRVRGNVLGMVTIDA
ncbi:MAG: cytochrome P450 [Pseudomonadota bacterium]|nr:cytochrome P450 [Pseudomonadota bacterium]